MSNRPNSFGARRASAKIRSSARHCNLRLLAIRATPCHIFAMAARPPLYHLIDLWISLTRGLHQAADHPETRDYFGARTADLLIRSAVYLGTIEGRPMTVTKLAAYVGIPRPTVIRHLHKLERRRLVERSGAVWRTAPDLVQRRKQHDFGELAKLVATAQRRLTAK
jgi:DNA-binding transcriptional ArsR family regulator